MIDPSIARRLAAAARKGREWIERRDQLIVEAVEGGASQAETARVAGLTQPAVWDILRRHRERQGGSK